MKVLPSLLRKGRGPFLPRSGTDQDSNVLSPRNDGSFPIFPTAVSSDEFISPKPQPIHDEHDAILASQEQCPGSPNNLPPPSSVILPTISYPPFSDEPSDSRPPTPTTFNVFRLNAYNISPDRRDQMWYKNQMYILQKEQQDLRSKNSTGYGVKKYCDEEESRSNRQKYFESQERPAGSFDCYDQKTPSPGGVEEFESLNKFQGLKRDASLLGIQHKQSSKNVESVSRLLSLAKSNDEDAVVFADDHYTGGNTSDESLKHDTPPAETQEKRNFLIKESVSKLLSLVKSKDEEGIFADDHYTEADTCDLEFSRDEDDEVTTLLSGISGTQKSASGFSGVSGTQDDATSGNSALDQRFAGEDETTGLSDCEYDTQDDNPWALPIHLRVGQEQTPNLDGDNASHLPDSQFDEEESMTSSYNFQFIDEDTNLFRSRRRKVKNFRASRKARGQQLNGQVPSQASASETDNTSILRSGKYTAQPNIVAKDSSGDDNDHVCCAYLPSLSKVREDVKVTYLEATKALNQVMYAFFIIEDDVNAMAERIRGAQFNEQSKAGTDS